MILVLVIIPLSWEGGLLLWITHVHDCSWHLSEELLLESGTELSRAGLHAQIPPLS